MNRAALAAALLAGALVTGIVAAQDATEPTPPAGSEMVSIEVFGQPVEADPSVPLQACVFGRSQGVSDATVTVVVVALTTDGLYALPPMVQAATGPYADAAVLDCLGLDPEPLG